MSKLSPPYLNLASLLCVIGCLTAHPHEIAQGAGGSIATEAIDAIIPQNRQQQFRDEIANDVNNASVDASEIPANTGESANTPGSTSSLNDFLQKFLLSVANDQLGLDGEDNLTFEWSKPFQPIESDTQQDMKLVLNLKRPELSEDLAMLVGETRASELSSGLDLTDSVTATFQFSLHTKRLGRNPQMARNSQLLSSLAAAAVLDHRAELISDTEATIGELCTPLLIKAMDTFPESDVSALDDFCAGEPNITLSAAISRDMGGEIQVLRDLMSKQQSFANARLDSYEERLVSSNFAQAVKLVKNQPQLIFSGGYQGRDDRAGTDEWNAKVTYELGFFNVNRLVRRCGGELYADKGECLSKYLKDTAEAKDPGRFSFSLEYIDRAAYSYADDVSGLNLDLDGSHSLIAEVVYGRSVGATGAGLGDLRIDAGFKYEDVSDDDMRNNRATASFTLSRTLIKELSLSLGLVWANKPEFRMEAEADLTARLGLTYKLGKPPS